MMKTMFAGGSTVAIIACSIKMFRCLMCEIVMIAPITVSAASRAIFITFCLNSVESYVLNLNLKSVFNKEKDKILFQTDHNKNCHFATGWRPALKEENHLHQVRV